MANTNTISLPANVMLDVRFSGYYWITCILPMSKYMKSSKNLTFIDKLLFSGHWFINAILGNFGPGWFNLWNSLLLSTPPALLSFSRISCAIGFAQVCPDVNAACLFLTKWTRWLKECWMQSSLSWIIITEWMDWTSAKAYLFSSGNFCFSVLLLHWLYIRKAKYILHFL